MTKKDFFRIIIKIFALYIFISTLFYFIPEYFRILQYSSDDNEMMFIILINILILFLSFVLIKQTDVVIRLFSLEKGFDDDQIIIGDLSMRKIISFAVIIIGFVLIVNNLSMFLHQVFFAFKKLIPSGNHRSVLLQLEESFDLFNLIYSSVSILIGYLLLSNYDIISKYLYNGD
jgi:hypothetical protein